MLFDGRVMVAMMMKKEITIFIKWCASFSGLNFYYLFVCDIDQEMCGCYSDDKY
jgi:hypothetical protein